MRGLGLTPNLFVINLFQFGHLVNLNSLIEKYLCLDLGVSPKPSRLKITLKTLRTEGANKTREVWWPACWLANFTYLALYFEIYFGTHFGLF